MKKLFYLSLAAFALSACNSKPTNYTYTARLLDVSVEKTGGDELRSKYTYDDMGSYKEIVQTKNGSPHSTTKNFALSNGKYTRIRIDQSGAAPVYYRLESSILSAMGYTFIKDDAVFRLNAEGDTGGEEIEKVVNDYDNNYNLTGYTHIVNGLIKVKRTNYDLTHLTENPAYYTYMETAEGDTEPVKVCVHQSRILDNVVVEYAIYRNWKSFSDTGIKVEQKSNYSKSETTESYTLTKSDNAGQNPVTTTVNNTYIQKTITY